MKRNVDTLRDCLDNVKRTNICIVGVREREDREKGLKKILIKVNTYSAEQTKYIQTEIVSEFFKFRKYQVMHTYPRSWK